MATTATGKYTDIDRNMDKAMGYIFGFPGCCGVNIGVGMDDVTPEYLRTLAISALIHNRVGYFTVTINENWQGKTIEALEEAGYARLAQFTNPVHDRKDPVGLWGISTQQFEGLQHNCRGYITGYERQRRASKKNRLPAIER